MFGSFTRALREAISKNYGSLVRNRGCTDTKQYGAHHAPTQHYSYYQISKTNRSPLTNEYIMQEFPVQIDQVHWVMSMLCYPSSKTWFFSTSHNTNDKISYVVWAHLQPSLPVTWPPPQLLNCRKRAWLNETQSRNVTGPGARSSNQVQESQVLACGLSSQHSQHSQEDIFKQQVTTSLLGGLGPPQM